jgi:ABC-type transport system involved in multi-copper enzyme maturation permease subunit
MKILLAFILFFILLSSNAFAQDPILDKAKNRSYINDPTRSYPITPLTPEQQQQETSGMINNNSQQGSNALWIAVLIVSNLITFIVAVIVDRWYG